MSEEKIKKLEEELELVKQQAQEYLDGWKRAKADYINREREIEREKSYWLECMIIDFILKILPISENLEKALENKSDEKFLEGIKQIKKQLDEIIKSFGVEKIKTVGEKFNPEFHEAIAKDNKDEKKDDKSKVSDNIIIEEVSSGYKINGKVIKVAKVVIK